MWFSIFKLLYVGVIFIHDCNPRNAIYQYTESDGELFKGLSQHLWTGDSWKAIVVLRALYSHILDVIVVDIDFGVAVVKVKSSVNYADVYVEHFRSYASKYYPVEASLLLQLLASQVHTDKMVDMLAYNMFYLNRKVLLNLHTMNDMRLWCDQLDNQRQLAISTNQLTSYPYSFERYNQYL